MALAAGVGLTGLLLSRVLPKSPYVSDILLAMLLGALVLNSPLRRLFRLAQPGEEREPDPYAAGLRFTGKWVLRLGIILMGFKVQTHFFGAVELALMAGVALVALPSAFFVAQALGARVGLRRPMVDLLAGGTMICGASAVNALAPVVGARREEQGLSIGIVFLFSVVALLSFKLLAALVGLSPAMAGIWSGLAVNDLSSAVAVGSQMGGSGGVMATAAKSARVLLMAPTLILFSLLRREVRPHDVKANVRDHLPKFVLGYLGFAVLRALGDRFLAGSPAWAQAIEADKLLVDVTMVTVSGGIGLHLALSSLLSAGARALVVGGGTSVWMAAVTLAMVTLAARGSHAAAALTGGTALLFAFLAHRLADSAEAEIRRLRARLIAGAPLSLAESIRVLNAAERDGSADEPMMRRVLSQLHPSIGELIPARESPLPHGEGCRWVTYWEGKSGWALVAICREPGSATPIHAHPHRLLGKTIEGVVEELRFSEAGSGALELTSRAVIGHNVLMETHALETVHVVRVVGPGSAIDLQLRGPEVGKPGRRMHPVGALDLDTLSVGARIQTVEEIDDRPGHGGEGAAAGRPA